MKPKKDRLSFNKRYNYRLVYSSDNIDLRHCGNCTHLHCEKSSEIFRCSYM